jgi:hypothetical protein
MTDVDLGPLSSLPPAQVLSDFGRPLITGISAAPTSLDLDTNTCFDITVSGFDGGLHYQSPVSHVG